jgi:phosphatidylinositol glycan class V
LFSIIIGKISSPWPNGTFSHVFRNVGLFRYWTISNAPLFLLAAPITFIMIASGVWALWYIPVDAGKVSKEQAIFTSRPERLQVLRNMAASQLALTVLTLTTAHVQIITRISSAYPTLLWYLAISCKGGSLLGRGFVGFIVVYGIVQAGLFASFLPPA